MQVSRVRVMLLRAILEQASGLGAIAAHQPSDTSEVLTTAHFRAIISVTDMSVTDTC